LDLVGTRPKDGLAHRLCPANNPATDGLDTLTHDLRSTNDDLPGAPQYGRAAVDDEFPSADCKLTGTANHGAANLASATDDSCPDSSDAIKNASNKT